MADNTPYDGSYLTEKGAALIAKLLSTSTPLKFTKATAGRGQVTPGLTPYQMEDLSEHVTDGMIAGYDNPVQGEAAVHIQVLSVGVGTGFFLSELGLWAEDPDEGEILYCYSVFDPPQWIRPDGQPVGNFATFTIVAIVSGIQVIEAIINPSSLVTRAEFEEFKLLAMLKADPYTNRNLVAFDVNGNAYDSGIPMSAIYVQPIAGLLGNMYLGESYLASEMP